MPEKMSRRTFLKSSAVVTAAILEEIASPNLVLAIKTDSDGPVFQSETELKESMKQTLLKSYERCINFPLTIPVGQEIDPRGCLNFKARIPFGESLERSPNQYIFYNGKVDAVEGPSKTWRVIQEELASKTFQRYTRTVLQPNGPKIIHLDFNISDKEKRFSVMPVTDHNYTFNRFLQNYPGNGKDQVYIYKQPEKSGQNCLTWEDVYNYLYGIADIGFDCSGFVWYMHTRLGKSLGIDLNSWAADYLGYPDDPYSTPLYINTPFYIPDSAGQRTLRCAEEVNKLRIGQGILFHNCRTNQISHSAIICDIRQQVPPELEIIEELVPGADFDKTLLKKIKEPVALIIYCQCIDWVQDRGVNKQFILVPMSLFEKGVSVKDKRLLWSGKGTAVFPGDGWPWPDQGWRFRNCGSSGLVFVLAPIKEAVEEKLGQDYYPLK